MQPPVVHIENVDAFEAFLRAGGCTHPTLAGMGPPIWSDIREVLELHELWSPEVQERLGKLMSQVREIVNREAKERTEKDEVKADG